MVEVEVEANAAMQTLQESIRQSNISILRDYEINIRFLSRGCVIRVGCKEIAFENIVDAMKALNDYVSDPYNKTKEWNKIFEE